MRPRNRPTAPISAVLFAILLLCSFQDLMGQTPPVSGEAIALSPRVIPRQYIVTFRTDVADAAGYAAGLAQQNQIEIRHTFSSAVKGFAATMSSSAAQMLVSDPNIASVEPDLYVYAFDQVLPFGVDRVDSDLNDIANIDGVDELLDVDIAIIDTGIDLDHPDLNVVFDQNFCKSLFCTFVKSGNDDNGHGSHVAGITAARDNDMGVVGVAPGARLWALKALDFIGSGSLSDVIKAIDFVTEHADEIEVVNMSLGAPGRSDALRAAIQSSVAAGVVYVVAAGNSAQDVYGQDGVFGTDDDFIPAAYPEVATVSAMGDTDGAPGGTGPVTSRNSGDDTFADFTNFSSNVIPENPVSSPGAAIDVAAPGVDVLSTWNDGGLRSISGTSMASPHVAGAAALEVLTRGRPTDAAGVAAVRQSLIDQAQAQVDWNPADTFDPDGNLEGLVNVATGPPNEPPSVEITSPAAGSVFDSGALISFAGTATDNEDGDLSASMIWRSDIDGDIGIGAALSRSLSDGKHHVTATAVDSGGKSRSDSIDITVGSSPGLAVSVTTDKPSYVTFNVARITVGVNDGTSPVEGARVQLKLTTPRGLSFNNAKFTNAGGNAEFRVFVFAPLFGTGTYTVETETTKDGFPPTKSVATFTVER